MRFYDVTGGQIKVENIDIREVTRKSLRAGYGMVLQDTWLKTGTIRENITMGRPDATEEEIIEAAKASHIHSYISRLPKGYDTWITEDGWWSVTGTEAVVMYCESHAVPSANVDSG